MTRDEYRAKCIEAMKRSLATKVGDLGVLGIVWWGEILAAAFDSLHGIAPVVPNEATEAMILRSGELPSHARRVWADMAAAGDLTNPPEPKP